MSKFEKILLVLVGVCILAVGYLIYKLNAVTDDTRQVEKLAIEALALARQFAPRPTATFDSTDFIYGNPNAKIKMIMFSNTNCGHCQSFLKETFPLIKKHYIDSGLVCFILKHVTATIYPSANYAARAGVCLSWQNKQDDYLSVLSASTAEDSISFRKELAKTSAVLNTFDACVASAKAFNHVASDRKQALALRLSGTPSFMINDSLVVGAQSFENFKKIFDKKKLKKLLK